MMRTLKILQHLFVFSISALCLQAAWSAGLVEYQFGKVTATKEGGAPRSLQINSSVEEGETVSTAEGSSARIRFDDRSQITLKANTDLKINSVRYAQGKPAQDQFSVNLLKGGLRAVTGLIGARNREQVKIGADVATIGIRGTHFGLQLCAGGNCAGLKTLDDSPMQDGLYADVATGKIAISNEAGTLEVAEGEFAFVEGRNTLPRKLGNTTGHKVTLPLCPCGKGSKDMQKPVPPEMPGDGTV